MSEETEALAKQLAEMKAQMDEVLKALTPAKEEEKALTKAESDAYEEYKQKVGTIRAQKKALQETVFNAQSQYNSINHQVNNLQYKLQEAEKAAKQEEERKQREQELQLLNQKWDRLTMAAAWREWAKDHQIKGAHFLVENRKVILADPMGLGKTLTSIITADMTEAATRMTNANFPFLGEEKQVYDSSVGDYVTKIVNSVERPVGKRILYFCPSSLIRNVEKEFRIWAKHRNVTFVGGMTKNEREFVFNFVLKGRADFVVICNYEAWRKDKSLIQSFIDLDPDTIILDEAHNLKDMKTGAYRGIRTLLDNSNPEYVIPMTGTPVLNRPQELFSLLTLVNPTEFYREQNFLATYCQQDDNGFWHFQPGGIDRLAQRIRKNFLRRTKDQAGIVLPDKTVIHHDIELDEETYKDQALVRKQMKEFATIAISEDKHITAAAMIAVFTRLRQIETWPAGIEMKDKHGVVHTKVDVEESQKIDYIISAKPDAMGDYNGLIPEAISDERIVVFSQFTAPLHELKRRIELAGYRAVVLDGSTPTKEREEIANDFDRRYTPKGADFKYHVVLCNYRVGGVGLNLTAATQMMILDEEWNPGKRDQAYDRIHRIGQTDPITIHVIRNQNTIDDWLAKIMEKKEGLVDGFTNTMITAQEFKDFLDGNSGLM